MNEPSLLFLDAPTLSVDGAASETMDQMIRDLKARGCTIAAVTHDPRLADRCDRIVELLDGRIVADRRKA